MTRAANEESRVVVKRKGTRIAMSDLTTHEDIRRHLAKLQHDAERVREWSIRAERSAKDAAVRLNELREAIPMCYPDGTGVLSAIQWVRWATKRLGYDMPYERGTAGHGG